MTAQLSRRSFLVGSGAAAATATLASVTAIVGTAHPAGASPVPARAAAAPLLSEVRVEYGTPTDVARRRPEQAWTRTPDGRVMTYDRTTRSWRSTDRAWGDVIGFGEVVLARWAEPAARNQLVMAFGSPPTTPTDPTAPTTPAPPSDPGTPTTSDPSPTGDPAGPGSTTTAPAAPTSGRPGPPAAAAPPRNPLAYTGAPLGALALAGLAAVGAGAALTFRRRRMQPPEHTGEPPPPATDQQ